MKIAILISALYKYYYYYYYYYYYVLNNNKVAFLMHESQKVASNLFRIRTCFKLYSSLLKCIYYFFPTETN